MNNLSERILDIFAFSGCFWILFFLLMVVVVRRFIVKRYEDETDLLSTVFFQEHASFTRTLPGFFSLAIYCGHLAICCWGWTIYGDKKVFRDINEPDEIIRNFTNKETKRVKWLLISGIIFLMHVMLLFLYNQI